MSARSTPTGLPPVSADGYPSYTNPTNGGLMEDTKTLPLAPIAERSGFGTVGTKVKALTNHFQINATKLPNLLEYRFTIKSKDKTDSEIKGRFRRRIVELLLDHSTSQNFKYAASDYRTRIIATRQLTPSDDETFTYTVDYYESEENGPRSDDRKLLFEVTLKFFLRFSTQDLCRYHSNPEIGYPLRDDHLAAINIALARLPSQDPNMTVMRLEKFFSTNPRNGRGDLGMGLEVYKGFFKSVRPNLSGLTLNLNTAASAMYWAGPLNRLIEAMLGTGTHNTLEKQLSFLESQLARLRVEMTYTGSTVRRTIYKMARAAPDIRPTSAEINFMQNGARVSVRDHFASTYPTATRNDVKALVVDVGSVSRSVFVPSDLCSVIPGQRYKGLLPYASQTTQMIRYACRRPAQNQALITNQGLSQIGVGRAGGPRDRFGLDISNKMMQISARILPSPPLIFRSGTEKQTSNGSWNLTGKKFIEPASENAMRCSWLELILPGRAGAANRGELHRAMERALRLYLGHPRVSITSFEGFEHEMTMMQHTKPIDMLQKWNTLLHKGIRLVFVILPTPLADYYRNIKISAECMGRGIHTVCTLRDDKTGNLRLSPDYLANVTLKANLKLGGINWKLQIGNDLPSFYNKRLMLIGADVVHPPFGAMLQAPSVAAVTGSIDSAFAIYPVSFALQQPDQSTKKAVEVIEKFGDLCEERLLAYKRRNNGVLPEINVVVRDGVSDGMLATVLNMEIMQLHRVYSKLYPKNQHPNTVCLVVKKRGHTRFYPPGSSQCAGFDPNGNPLPGFVVDTHIASEISFDYFMVSHKGIQGTSVPMNAVIIHNDLGASADELQRLTHAMCFLWGRSTKSIGYPAPARAADTACERAKLYLRPVYCPPAEVQPKPVYQAGDHWPGHIASNLKDSMFYV